MIIMPPTLKKLIGHIAFGAFCLFVWVEALRPSQQFFSHVGTDLLERACVRHTFLYLL